MGAAYDNWPDIFTGPTTNSVAYDATAGDIIIGALLYNSGSGTTSSGILGITDSNGTFDSSFGSSGETTLIDPNAASLGFYSNLTAIACSSSNIYVGTQDFWNEGLYATELSSSGAQVANFGGTSTPWIELTGVANNGTHDFANNATVLSNGDVVFGAYFNDSPVNEVFWRVHSNGTATTWNSTGTLDFDLSFHSPFVTNANPPSVAVNPSNGDIVVDTSSVLTGAATWISGTTGVEESLQTPWIYNDGAGNWTSDLAEVMFTSSGSVITTGENSTFGDPFLCIYNYGPDTAVGFASQSGGTLDIDLGILNTPGTTTVTFGGNAGVSEIIVNQDGDAPVYTGVTDIHVEEDGSGDTLNVVDAASSVPFSFDPSMGSATLNVDSGTMEFAQMSSVGDSFASFNIASGAEVLLAATTNPDTSTLFAHSFSLASGGTLDLANNKFLLDYNSGSDPFSLIRSDIVSGYNSGSWNGTGIISSAAQANSSFGLGYADGVDGVVSGLGVGYIEVMYTLLGDANLDGIVNGIDFGIVAGNFNQGVTGWDQGDFDYNGIVNGIDFGDLSGNFNHGI